MFSEMHVNHLCWFPFALFLFSCCQRSSFCRPPQKKHLTTCERPPRPRLVSLVRRYIHTQVVWGLSILGHVPRNSLLESLAGLLTDRLRDECERITPPALSTAAASAPATASASASAAADLNSPTTALASAPVGATAVAARNPASGIDGEVGTSTATVAEDVAGSKVSLQGNGAAAGTRLTESAASDAEVGEGASGVGDGGMRGAEYAGEGDRHGPVAGVGDDGNNAVATVAAVQERVVTSGTDLATAALSFAYAHARCDTMCCRRAGLLQCTVRNEVRHYCQRETRVLRLTLYP